MSARMMRLRSRARLLLPAGLCLLASCAPGGGFSPTRTMADGQTHGQWRSVYHGYGSVVVTLAASDVVTLQPQAAADPDVTHGALVTTVDTHRDVDFTVSVRTETQLRRGTPNPWEVGWVLWNYRDDSHFYAIALKPNGWELSKQDPAYPGEQRFLAAQDTPAFPIGQSYQVRVSHHDDTMRVWVDDRPLVTFTDTERPYREGAVGLYTEDARVVFTGYATADQEN